MLLSGLFSRLVGESIRAGTLYSVIGGKGYFQVAKVLLVDQGGVHVRVYKNRFATRPVEVTFETLELGTIHDSDGFGLGHLPLKRAAFRDWQPRFLGDSAVIEDELDGYREWQSAKGGYFGQAG